MKIGFLGDTHQNPSAVRFACWVFDRLNVRRVVQVGDFGLGQDQRGQTFLERAEQHADNFDITLWVVPGNHENWDYINAVTKTRTEFAVLMPHVFLAPRGMRWNWGGMSFVGLGGAPSVDRMWRLRQKKRPNEDAYWFAGEQITQEDVDYTVAGGYADVMVAHDAPHGIRSIEAVIGGNPHGFDPVDLLYAEDGRKLITEAFKGVSPAIYFHGHYHFPVIEDVQRPQGEYGETTRIYGLDCEFNNFSMAVLDTETGEVEMIDHKSELLPIYRAENFQ